MDINNFAREIKEYENNVNKWLNHIEGKQYSNENNTMIKIVLPLFEILGWNTLSKDIEFEYPVRDREVRKVRHVDIALHTKKTKTPKILVEVKPIQISLFNITSLQKDKLKHSRQMFRYLKDSEANYGIVVNGKELVLFDKRYVRRDCKRAKRLFALKFNDFILYRDVLIVLSKEFIENSVVDKLAKAYNRMSSFKWWEKIETSKPKLNAYSKPLIFAREFLKRELKIT